MDNEMIKRVSEAIINCPNASDYQTLVAKRAIEAMREPTEKMIMIDAPDMPAGGSVKEIWQSMIDAVIND